MWCSCTQFLNIVIPVNAQHHEATGSGYRVNNLVIKATDYQLDDTVPITIISQVKQCWYIMIT